MCKYLFLSALPFTLMLACHSSHPSASLFTAAVSPADKLQGNWESVVRIGGGRRIDTSNANGSDHSRFLQIKDSTYSLWIDDSLYEQKTFKLDTITAPEDTAAHLFFHFADGSTDQTVYFRHDSLLINPEAIAWDGVAYYYLPTKKQAPKK